MNIYLIFILLFNECQTTNPSHENPSDVKYFESRLDETIGYWSPSTSSIDWCERNYAFTPYLAEFWNSISSLSMCLFASVLLIEGFINKIEKRFMMMSISFGFVGIGSFYFHGTLTFVGQMFDELPMVYSMIIWFFILFRMNTFHSHRCYYDPLILLLICYGLFWTYIHTLKSFVLIFQIHFGLMVIGGIMKLIYLYRNEMFYPSSIKYLILSYILLLIPAMIVWTIDQHYCSRLNELWINPQFHSWWHLICAYDCHIGIVCSQGIRLLSVEHHQAKLNNQLFNPNKHLKMKYYFLLPLIDYSFNTNKYK